MKILALEEIESIHNELTEMFASTSDPIYPRGVKDKGLLESAVARQETGFDNKLKYDECCLNAATLMYGICMNHCFHNGNKRTALVAGIIHLDRNKRLLVEVQEHHFYDLMIRLASHELLYLDDLHSREIKKMNFKGRSSLTVDEEVSFLGQWLKKASKLAQQTPREVRLGDLIRSLKFHGCEVEQKDGSTIISRSFNRRLACFMTLPKNKRYKIFSTNPRWKVSPTVQDDLRSELELDQKHGFDDSIFFEFKSQVDTVLNEYRKLLGRLAKT